MGCAECKLLQLLKREEYIEELIGVDISTALSLSAPCLRPLVTDYLHPRLRPLTVKLMQGIIPGCTKCVRRQCGMADSY